MSDTSDGDPKKLLELESALKRLGGDKELFKEFVEIFFEDSPELIKGIEDGLNVSDARAVEKSAHALKGLASNFGAKDFVDVSSEIEKAGREGSLAELPKDFKKLQRLYEKLCGELKVHV